MTTAMLTALDASGGRVLDVTAMTAEEIDLIHGRRAAQANGYDIVCRQCHRPGHLVIYGERRAFFRHNPGERAACILSEFGRGESTEHIAAKIAIVRAHRALDGWVAEPERRFEANGETVIVDVFAHPTNPGEHRVPTAWEIQVSPQPHGVTVERTAARRRATGARTAWATPHPATLGDSVGIITDPKVEKVTDRLWTSPAMNERLPEMSIGGFIGATQGKRRRLIWADAGFDGEFIAYPVTAASSSQPARRQPDSPNLGDIDRACARTPVRHRGVIGDVTWSTVYDAPIVAGPKPEGDQLCRKCDRPYRDHTGELCAICRQNVEHHPDGFAACIDGQIRMAHSRPDELTPLDGLVLGHQ